MSLEGPSFSSVQGESYLLVVCKYNYFALSLSCRDIFLKFLQKKNLRTAIKFNFISQTDLPNSGPFIAGEENAYQSDDKLNLNCTSGRSHPASKLQFFINDDPVSEKVLSEI